MAQKRFEGEDDAPAHMLELRMMLPSSKVVCIGAANKGECSVLHKLPGMFAIASASRHPRSNRVIEVVDALYPVG